MLDIGLSLRVRGGEKNARLRLDKACKIGRDPCLPGASFLHVLIGAAGTLTGLYCLDGRREGNVACIGVDTIHDAS
jgi:hypothetical protein